MPYKTSSQILDDIERFAILDIKLKKALFCNKHFSYSRGFSLTKGEVEIFVRYAPELIDQEEENRKEGKIARKINWKTVKTFVKKKLVESWFITQNLRGNSYNLTKKEFQP